MPIKLWCQLGRHWYDHYTSHNTVTNKKKSCDLCKQNELIRQRREKRAKGRKQ